MEKLESAPAIFADLRKLAAESPREARTQFAALLDSNANTLEEVLRLASAPGEGRLRQLIANTVTKRHDKARVAIHLSRWLEIETDEFARAAITAAVAGIQSQTFHPIAPPEPPQLVETYRYVADRLCHRVRNSLTGPAQHLRKLESLLNGGTDAKSAEAKATVGQLKDALRDLSRIVEFDTGDSYFQWRSIDLPDWLKSMNNQYVSKNAASISVDFLGLSGASEIRIRANDYLLETIFWNLWKNAQQAVGAPCKITVKFSSLGAKFEILVSDNGRGFTAEDVELAFVDQFKRRGGNFGRGLLEVQDAARRLAGAVELAQVAPGEYRMKLSFPLATP
jgi:signal transduction histidine kinase